MLFGTVNRLISSDYSSGFENLLLGQKSERWREIRRPGYYQRHRETFMARPLLSPSGHTIEPKFLRQICNRDEPTRGQGYRGQHFRTSDEAYGQLEQSRPASLEYAEDLWALAKLRDQRRA